MNTVEKYIPVRLHTLRPESVPGFDIYVLVGDRYVHYLAASDPLDPARLSKLQANRVKKLFIPETAEDRYLDYLDQGLTGLKTAGGDFKKEAAVAQGALVTAAENAERSLASESAFRRTEGQFLKIVDFLMSDRRAVKAVLDASGAAIDDFQHAANVTTLALSVCSRSGIADPTELLQMGFAGLLHDIAKPKLGLDPLKARAQFTSEERKRYERHPEEAVAMLSGKPFVTPRVLGLIADHEELGRGRGFPGKKDVSKLAKPYQIFNLVNAFDRFCMEAQRAPLGAIDAFFENQGELHDPELINVLGTVLT